MLFIFAFVCYIQDRYLFADERQIGILFTFGPLFGR
jgi:hypothetical protein